MKHPLLTASLFVALSVLTGCASTPQTELEKEANTTYTNVQPLERGEALLMTYKFQDALSKSEYQALMEHLNKEEVRASFDNSVGETAHYAKDIGSNLLLFSDVWQKAYVTGDLLSTTALLSLRPVCSLPLSLNFHLSSQPAIIHKRLS